MGEMGESGDWPRSTGSSRPFIDSHAERERVSGRLKKVFAHI